MSVKTPKIVQSDSGWFSKWLLLVVLIIVVLFWSYREWSFLSLQKGYAGSGLVESAVDLTPNPGPAFEEKERHIQELEEQRDELRLKVAALERTSQIDKEAVRRAQDEMKSLHDQRLKMEEELVFLRGMVAGSKKEGLSVHDFELQQGTDGREFRYRFTVSQSLVKMGTASGWIRLKLDGKRDDKSVTLSLKDLVADKADRIKMRFKHFQNVQGVITLPEDFQPSSMEISVEPTNGNLSAIKKRFDWLVAG